MLVLACVSLACRQPIENELALVVQFSRPRGAPRGPLRPFCLRERESERRGLSVLTAYHVPQLRRPAIVLIERIRLSLPLQQRANMNR